MKLKNVSCTQFAGICDRNIALEDGVNVICGQNESGKSTLVNLISRTLFQKAKLDGRKDKGFMDSYFPSARKGSSIKGDFADGSVTFETDEGTYTLKKEWGSDSRVTLHTPDGILRDAKKIDAILREILVYGEGVYSDMLLLAQNNMDEALETLLNASARSDAKQEITDAASQAFAESDGVSMDAVEAAISEKIETLAGKHWDEERSAPVRKADRWKSGLGEILKAYYRQEDAQAVLDQIHRLSEDRDHTARDYTDKADQVEKAVQKSNDFQTYAQRLKEEKANGETMDALKGEKSKYEKALIRWPQAESEADAARKLEKEQADRKLLDQYAQAKTAHDELDKVDQDLLNRDCPTPEEIGAVQTAERDITNLENQLCGMNLNAVVHMLGGHSVEITTLRDGKELILDGEQAALTEAVKITVPGVMEMELTPANVDAAAVKNAVEEAQGKRKEVLDQYKVETLEELEKLKKDIGDAREQDRTCRGELDRILQGADFETLQAQANAITDPVRSAKEIESAIVELCGGKDLAYFRGKVGGELETFCRDYTNPETLSSKLDTVKENLDNLEKNITSLEDIPAEYRNIADPEAYQEKLKTAIDDAQAAKDNALAAKSAAETSLENCQEALVGDPEEQLAQAKRCFEERLEELRHWRRIQQVFRDQRAQIHDNPMEDIARSFAHYLSLISDGRVVSEFPQEDKLQMNIYSDNFRLDYQKLSEGTKETVSLAFRLAVLDHLFPEGGGLAVFDDPFTDMDEKRMQQSCALLKDCAQRHQVIVLTCREEYIPLLGGHTIRV